MGETDKFPQLWLEYVGAIDLITGVKRAITPENKLDPVVEAAFVDLRSQLTAQLCGPSHPHDPNGIGTLLELERHGHDLDENKLALWAITEGFSARDTLELMSHVRKVTTGHRYAVKSRGSWVPNYDRWVHASSTVAP